MIQKNERRRYASDLSDSQWAVIEPLFPPAGNRSKWEKRELVDAVLYFVDKWLQMAKSAPRFSTVYNSGKFLLRCNPKRVMGKDPRSVGGTSADRRRAEAWPQLCNHRLAKRKTTSAAEERGIDGGKKQKDANGTS